MNRKRCLSVLTSGALPDKTLKFGYLVVITGFAGLLGTLSYYLASELFGDGSINNLITKTAQKIEEEMGDAIGKPFKYFGETTRYNRQFQASHNIVKNEDGSQTINLVFFLQGTKKVGKVFAELNDHGIGVWDYNYLYMECFDGSKIEFITPPPIFRKRNNVFDRMAEYLKIK